MSTETLMKRKIHLLAKTCIHSCARHSGQPSNIRTMTRKGWTRVWSNLEFANQQAELPVIH